MAYASDTSVPVERSRAEIERLLSRHRATKFMHGWDDELAEAVLAFEVAGRRIQIKLPLPRRDEERFTRTPSRKSRRRESDAVRAWEQACRSRWRALLLVIKAKLEAIEAKITTLDDEFLPFMITASGQTLGEVLRPQLERSREAGEIPPLKLLGG